MANNVVEHFAAASILHDEINVQLGLNDSFQLYDMRMRKKGQDANFSPKSLLLSGIFDLTLVYNFDGYFLSRLIVTSQLHSAIGAVTKCFNERILFNRAAVCNCCGL